MKFIKDHKIDAIQFWIFNHLPEQQGVGHKNQTSRSGHSRLKTDLVSDFGTDLPPALLTDALTSDSVLYVHPDLTQMIIYHRLSYALLLSNLLFASRARLSANFVIHHKQLRILGGMLQDKIHA